MISRKFKNEIHISLIGVWIVISMLLTTVLFTSLFFPEILTSSAPVCFSKLYNNAECSMCGMTRAFNEISKGNLSEASALNSMSILLYSGFAINTIIFFSCMIPVIRRKFVHLKKPIKTL